MNEGRWLNLYFLTRSQPLTIVSRLMRRFMLARISSLPDSTPNDTNTQPDSDIVRIISSSMTFSRIEQPQVIFQRVAFSASQNSLARFLDNPHNSSWNSMYSTPYVLRQWSISART